MWSYKESKSTGASVISAVNSSNVEAKPNNANVNNEADSNNNSSDIPKFCSECGTPTNGGKFCSNCGHKLV